MFSSIRPAYSTPPNLTPATSPRLRPRTISEPPEIGKTAFKIPAGVATNLSQYRYDRAVPRSTSLHSGKAKLRPELPSGILFKHAIPGSGQTISPQAIAASMLSRKNVRFTSTASDDIPENVLQEDMQDDADTEASSHTPASGRHADISNRANPAFPASVNLPVDIGHHDDDHMKIELFTIFKEFITQENEADIKALIEDRTRMLSASGIDAAELRRRLDIADQVDNITAGCRGAFSSLGFIVGTQAANVIVSALQKTLPASMLLFVPGFTIGIVDRMLSSLLVTTRVDYYTKAVPEKLEPVMQFNLGRLQRTPLAEMAHQAGTLAAPYSTRNVVRSVVAPIAASLDPGGHRGLVSALDTMIDGLGGIPAGSFSEALRNNNDRGENLMHRAYVMGRTDWIEQLETLKHDAWSLQRLSDLGHRTGAKALDLPHILENTCKAFFSVDTLTEMLLLPAGLAGIQYAKTTAVNMHPAGPEAAAFMQNSIGTFLLGIMYYILGVAMTASARRTDIAETVRSGIHQCTGKSPSNKNAHASDGCELRRRSVIADTNNNDAHC